MKLLEKICINYTVYMKDGRVIVFDEDMDPRVIDPSISDMEEAAIAIAAMKESLLHEGYSEFEEGEGLLVTARRLTGYDAGNWDEVPSEVSKFFDIEDIDSVLVTEYKDFYVEE